MIVLDTSGLLAAIDGSDRYHAVAAEALRRTGEPKFLSPFVLAELDYLLRSRVSSRAADALLGEVADGAYHLEPFTRDDVMAASAVLRRYADIDLGLADASIVVIAERHGTDAILTLDERHFRAVAGPRGRPFRILPADRAT